MIRNKLAVAALLLAVAPALVARPRAPDFVEAQVKALGARYNQVEEQLARSVHYTQTHGEGEATITKHAWLDGADDPIKFAVERTEGAARELREYLALDSDEPYNGLFIVDRKESPLPDGGTEVTETRRYFGSSVSGSNTDLLRELRKTARFKKGEPLDVSKVPNVTAPATPPDATDRTPEQEKASTEMFEAITTIANELQKSGSPATDPFADVKGDSHKYRAIHGTGSPDGRYAIALGFAREQIDWDAVIDNNWPEEPKTYFAEDDEQIRNYVIEVAQKKIIGETHCAYLGTRRRYNHRECSVVWSPNSQNFVQLYNDKWWSTALVAGVIASKGANCIDLVKTVDRKAYAFVKKRYDSENGGDLSYSVAMIGNDGLIELRASANIASGERKGDVEFAVEERVQLRNTAGGLRAEVVNVKRAPRDE